MKHIKNRIFLMLLVVVVTFASCSKTYLDRLPPTSLTPSTAFLSETDMASALRGAYAGLRNVDYYGRSFLVFGDLIADNAYVALSNTGRYTQFNLLLYNSSDGNVTGFWNAAYAVILRCNNIINAPLTGTANINEYRGEAYAIRALCYFDLVRYFAKPYTDDPTALGVPIVLTYDAFLKPGRNTVKEVYTLINNDLTQAFTLMTLYTNSTQFSKYAARGLQAKVYLTQGDNANAKTAALDVINNGGFSLVTAANHASFWNGTLPRTDKVETLMEVSSDAIANNGFDGLPNIYSQAGYGDLLVSNDLNALFLPTDVRKALYPAGTHGGSPAVVVNKYPNVYGTDESDRKVLRLSDVYLIAAEASLPSDEATALANVNAITSRRNATPIASTGAQLLADIRTERRKELAFEGDRYLDLQRLKVDVVRNAANYPSSALSLPYSNFRRLLPIPVNETDANPTIKPQQNPGY
jgi:hypothetical protein